MNSTILLTVDCARRDTSVVDMVRDIARRDFDRVVVLHVHELVVGRFGRIQVDCGEGEGERVAAEAVERLTGAGIAAEADIRKSLVGGVARTIVAAADDCDAAMIVLGASGAHDIAHLPLGSVSLRVLHLAMRPVLIVPRKRTARDAPRRTVVATAD
jgi:nucleotide-binding universal stress UspA family protein